MVCSAIMVVRVFADRRAVTVAVTLGLAWITGCGGSVVRRDDDSSTAARVECDDGTVPTCVTSCSATTSFVVGCESGGFSCPAGTYAAARCPDGAFESPCGPEPYLVPRPCGCECGANRLYSCGECPDAGPVADSSLDGPGPVDGSADAMPPSDSAAVDAPPAEAGTPQPVWAVEVGAFHSCAVATDGSAWCWGYNLMGQLTYQGGSGVETHPKRIAQLQEVRDIDLGRNHTCAVDAQGSVWCWGMNSHGQIGNGTAAPDGPGVMVPYKVPVPPAVAVGCGDIHSCAVLADGRLACWGWNSQGQSGQAPDDPTSLLEPRVVPGLTDVVEVGLGGLVTCALRGDGSVWCFGMLVNPMDGPTAMGGVTGAERLAVGDAHACALDAKRDVSCWGVGTSGQLGQGTAQSSEVPLTVLSGARSVSAGSAATCAVLLDGTTRCWGAGSVLQAPYGSDFPAPVDILGVTGAAAVAVGEQHNCVVFGDQTVSCWGLNYYGQCGNGTNEIYAPLGPVVW